MENRGQVFAIAGIVVVTIIIIILASVLNGNSGTTTVSMALAAPVTPSDHVQGSATSTVTFVEYGDFQCPACGEYEPSVEALEKEYGDRVAFVFRNFPLTQVHPNALAGAAAAEAAALQGKYWQMHDLLFAKQQEWSLAQGIATKTYLDSYATSLGLDVTKFDADMISEAVATKIKGDMDSGTAAEIDHTPTFFINLHQIANPATDDEFRALIDAALAGA